jgi:hypothetical protein
VNLLEQYISKNIPIGTWRAACSSSPAALDVCGLILAAAGLVDRADDIFVDVTSDNNEYVASYFAANQTLESSE